MDISLYKEAAAQQERRRIEDPWLNVLGEALSDKKGKLRSEDAWIIVDMPERSRTQEHNARLGEAMRELGSGEHRLRFDGLLKYCYARGNSGERRHRILVERDGDSHRLKVVVELDGDSPVRIVPCSLSRGQASPNRTASSIDLLEKLRTKAFPPFWAFCSERSLPRLSGLIYGRIASYL